MAPLERRARTRRILAVYIIVKIFVATAVQCAPAKAAAFCGTRHARVAAAGRRGGLQQQFAASSTSKEEHEDGGHAPVVDSVAIVGGGLAGLSTAYHLLHHKTGPPRRVTILDRAVVGTSGASAVAGGLLHPLSPRGKLVHWGLEGVAASNELIAAAVAASSTPTSIVLRNELYRVALDAKQATQLQATAAQLPGMGQWIPPEDLDWIQDGCTDNNQEDGSIQGAFLLPTAKVLHVPTYLQGLWAACQALAQTQHQVAEWIVLDNDDSLEATVERALQDHDAVVLAGGAGMFDALSSSSSKKRTLRSGRYALPVQLVRGQSVELRVSLQTDDNNRMPRPGLVAGKYVSPLVDPNLVLVGATHEFQARPLSPDQVVAELRARTEPLLGRDTWESAQVERVTTGTRVQSERGAQGRRPMIGRLSSSSSDTQQQDAKDKQDSAAVWIFTGLSSRGLLYHGLYGKMLANAVVQGSEDSLFQEDEHIFWWRK